jgi:hypothetical protein
MLEQINKISKMHTIKIDTYPTLLNDKTCLMLIVPKGLKQGELRVPVRHLVVQQ